MNDQVYKILIIDDSPEDRAVFRDFLQKDQDFSYSFLEEELGEDGAATCRRELPDCVLLDYNLPDTDGLSVVKQINPDPANPAFPVILMTGEGSEKLAVKAIKNGAQDYLVKGKISADELRLTIHNAIEIVKLRGRNKQSEAALRETEERRRLALEAGKMGTWEWLADSRMMNFDEYTAEIFGFESDQLSVSDQTVFGIIDEADVLQLKRTFQKSLETGENYVAEFRIKQPDGETRWIYSTGHPMLDENGELKRMVGVHFDITERKQSEENQRESEERLKLGVEVADFAICEIDYRDNTNHLSKEAAQLYGLGDQDITVPRETVHAVFHPDDAAKLAPIIAESLNPDGAGWFKSEHRIILKSGEVRWLSVRKQIFFDRTQNPPRPVRGILAARDITNRKSSEASLRDSEERFRLASDAAAALVYDVDLTGKRKVVAHGLERVTGYSNKESDLSSDWWHSLIHPEDLPAHLENYQKQLSDGGTYVAVYRIRRKDGAVIWVEDTAQIVRDETGANVQLVGTAVDINERKLAEETIYISEERLNLLHEITANPTLGDAARLQSLIRLGCEQFNLENGIVGKITGDNYKVALAISPGNAIAVGFSCPVKDALCDEVLKRNDLLAIESVGGGEWRGHRAHSVFGTEVYFGVPISVDGRIFGTLCFTSLNPRKESFTRGDQEFLRLLAQTIGAEMTRQRFTEQLRVSEERLSLAMTGANIGTFDWNIKTGEIEWSGEIEEAAGLSPADFGNSFEGFSKLIHPLDRERVEGCINEAMKDGTYECEFRMLRGDGTIRWVIAKGRVFFDDDGQPTRLVGVDIDITKRRLAEDELLENQRFTQSIIETAPSILYTFDLKTKTNTYLTGQAAQVLGYSFDELKEANENFLTRYLHPDDTKAAERHFNKISKTHNGEVFEFEYRMRHKSGEWRWFRSRDRVFKRDESGKPAEILGIALDITERKQAEDLLRESDARMRLATEATEVGVWEWNVITDQIRWDAQMFRIYGVEPTENGFVPYSVWSKSVLPEELARQEELLEQARSGGGHDPREFRIRRNNDGEIRYIYAVETVRKNAAGQVEWILGTNLDITDRKLAEEELRKSEEFNRTVLENSPDCVKILDGEGRLVYMNTNGLCLLEIDDFAQFKDEYWWNVWQEETKPVVREAVEKSLHGETVHFRAFCPTAKGTPKWWDVVVAPIPGKDGKTERIFPFRATSPKANESNRHWRKARSRAAKFWKASRTAFSRSTKTFVFTI